MTGHVPVAAITIDIGNHPTTQLFGMTINVDTVLATAIAAAVVIGLGLYVRAKVTSGVPSGPQLFLESILAWSRDQVEQNIGVRVAPYVVPLAFTLFVFILICNWLSILPVQFGSHDFVPPPTSDVNLVYAMTLLVIVWIHIAGVRRRGAGRYFLGIAKGHVAFMAPINLVVKFFAEPLSLALRLFGNIFAGTIMVSVIGLLPAFVLWAPNAGWKLFDMAIGLIQAFIFALLTILYFGEAVGDHEKSGEGAH